ncbi:MAG: histidine kinase, partial [Ruminococcus sp.]|nr:histidine kinase [Ruminococcus sp.]
MKKIIEGKIWTAVCVALTLLMIVSAIWIGMRYYVSMDIYETPSMFLEGEYSVDGGEWKPIEKDRYITDHFHKIVFKGKMSKKLLMYFGSLTISSKNVWYTLKTTDGTVIQSYHFDDEKLSYEHTKTDKPLALDMPNTPGYCVKSIFPDYLTEIENITEDSELIFEVEYPYGYALVSYNDCVDVTAYYNEGMYLRFFYDALPPVLLFVLICFFGLFFFPVASFILGKIDYKYLTFGMLSFLWGLYMIMQQISGYLNLWIVDPTVCMMMDKITGYCFVAAVLFYFKANMSSRGTRIAANIASAVYLSCVFTVFILHLCHIRDLNASSMTMNFATAGSIVMMIVLLCVEMRINRNALFFLLSWVPLLLTVAIDAVDQFIHLPGSHYFNYGLAITMIVQIVRLIGDLRFQYKEAIRHQQMQKELYEAKVSVMTSQIRPHFMYNALTSIAMMCEIDSKIAKEATITFAKYLRGNMDSLKQTGPVPFTQELEHLKKYLYIEKL